MADKKDPTVRSGSSPSSATDGVHPAVPVSEGADAAANKEFKDNPDKPDPTSIAQVEVVPDSKS